MLYLRQIFYVRNNHPLLSICLSHRDHPFSGRERVVVLFLLLIVAWGNAAVINAVGAQNCVCPDDPTYDDPTQVECRDQFQTLSFAFSVVNAAMLIAFGALLKAIATCSCVQRFHNAGDVGKKGAQAVETVRHRKFARWQLVHYC